MTMDYAGIKIEKRPICTCKFPILVKDMRNGIAEEMIIFYGIPLDVITDVGTEPPEMEIVDKVSPSGIKGKYMKVTWLEPHSATSEHEVIDHIVVAGCEEGVELCDDKSVYIVYHPIEEWYARHVIEVK